MKKLFYLLLLLPVLLMGCKKGTEEPEAVKLSVDPSSIISPSAGADYTLTLTAPEAWTASCADSWVKVSPTSGNAGTVEISVKISADKTSTEASSKIVFKSGDQTVEVPVKRLAKDPARLIIASETAIQTPKDGGTYAIKVESNIKWQISSNASWAKIDGEAVKRNNAIISVTVDQATTPEETVATLTVSPMEGSGVEKQTVTITRSASDATSMTIDKNKIDAPADGGSYTITVNTTAQWRATKSWDADWVTINNETGDGNGSFDIKVAAATSGNDASTVITVQEVRSDYYTPVQLNILVSRKGKPAATLSVDPTSITSPAEGGDFTVTIKSNYAWTASLSGTKIFSVSAKKGDGDGKIIVTVKPTTEEREATGTIIIKTTYGNEQATVKIHREAYEKPKNPYYFSVEDGKYVYFSKGNLQYHPRNKSWRFAEDQYDMLGKDIEEFFNISNPLDSRDKHDGWIDLFMYGSSGATFEPYEVDYYFKVEQYPVKTSIAGTDNDWGVWLTKKGKLSTDATSCGRVGNRQWRTLTELEWIYLFYGRSWKIKDRAMCAIVNYVKGIVLLPDNFVMPSGVDTQFKYLTYSNPIYEGSYADNTIIASTWSKLEQAGAVFLPATGTVDSSFKWYDYFGYWSADVKVTDGKTEAIILWGPKGDSGDILTYNVTPAHFHAVRLVQDVNE
ncbi:MAG: BACON domain-containing protein [Paludibacteraceae bacterium]|nr:BACON domain-containing protein [Paludibacteraceae bacterium]